MDKLENSLSIEQEFNHKIFSDRVQELSRDEAQELLVLMHKQMLYKDNIYKELFLSQEKDIIDALFGVNKN
ncbi:MAG: NblA/ycf18 family protein [Waterburya sp.]